jgi:hypothetical protein
VIVSAGEVATLADTFSVGSAGNYTNTLTCTGTSGLSGNTLTIGGGDINITCTLTSTSKIGFNVITGYVFNDGGAPNGGVNTGTPNDGIMNGAEAPLPGVAV